MRLYRALYTSSPSTVSPPWGRQAVWNSSTSDISGLPQLNPTKSQALDAPLTAGEPRTVLKELKLHKAPGPDDFSLLYYKIFANTLTNPFIQTFTAILDGHHLPLDILWATIKQLLFPNRKNRTQWPHFHPISLLNVDLKHFSKILANRLRPFSHWLIHPNQISLVPHWKAKDNTTRALNVIYLAHATSPPYTIPICRCLKKAFDGADSLFL